MSDVTLLKMVVLQKKRSGLSNKNCWSYAILPYDKLVVYDHTKYELVPEAFVIKSFNQGTISPLIIFAQKAKGDKSSDDIYLLYNDRINTEYVIMGGDSNTESIRIKTEIFRKILVKVNVIFQNIIE